MQEEEEQGLVAEERELLVLAICRALQVLTLSTWMIMKAVSQLAERPPNIMN
jgi:hypothetical protein